MQLIDGAYIGVAGDTLPFKIECDGMTEKEWKVIAEAVRPKLQPFRKVIGVPKGGMILAKLLTPYITKGADGVLIVDDVWTTGRSMRKVANVQMLTGRYRYWQGVVAFSRGTRPINVVAFMQLLV